MATLGLIFIPKMKYQVEQEKKPIQNGRDTLSALRHRVDLNNCNSGMQMMKLVPVSFDHHKNERENGDGPKDAQYFDPSGLDENNKNLHLSKKINESKIGLESNTLY